MPAISGRSGGELSPGSEGRLETLVRELARLAAEAAPGANAHDGVLLDLEVNGIRCLLMRSPPAQEQAVAWLSPREREIARMIARGYANKMIAAVLDISTHTVNTYVRRLFAKLAVSSRAAMVARLHDLSLFGTCSDDSSGSGRRSAQVASAG